MDDQFISVENYQKIKDYQEELSLFISFSKNLFSELNATLGSAKAWWDDAQYDQLKKEMLRVFESFDHFSQSGLATVSQLESDIANIKNYLVSDL